MDDRQQDGTQNDGAEDPVEAELRRLEAVGPIPPLSGRVAGLIPARRFVGPELWLRVIREG